MDSSAWKHAGLPSFTARPQALREVPTPCSLKRGSHLGYSNRGLTLHQELLSLNMSSLAVHLSASAVSSTLNGWQQQGELPMRGGP
eukprot:scaffold275746_cov21-Tisochrysis_lutea.AAC.1